ncbi:polyprenyl diphosphate synthase [Streptomyces sp. IBSNAI002]|uniref:polyprenyl diphosphate synthase n=1 Tax=Streptomyces sp. IBSNAI002 TaxID=3457500 RepID=UPI003FD0DB62
MAMCTQMRLAGALLARPAGAQNRMENGCDSETLSDRLIEVLSLMADHDARVVAAARHQEAPATESVASSPRSRGDPRPRHIGVILDGNRRWARDRHLPLEQAYMQGASRVEDLVTWCGQTGIPVVTVWALSQNNLQRDPAAVAMILEAVTAGLERIAAAGRWCIRPIGKLSLLPPAQASRLLSIRARAADGCMGVLNVAVAYDGRADIVAAVRELLRHAEPSPSGSITEADLECHLSTAGQPDIDLVIRTSGEQRLSGFMPWQTTEAELYFTDIPWPEFSAATFDAALDFYGAQQRRHGR